MPQLHRRSMLSLAEVCVAKQVDALTIANTQPEENSLLEVGSGGLSGKPIYGRMVRMVSEVRERIGDGADINACGGVFTAKDARSVIEAGAKTVQLLTGFVYNGPCVAPYINKALSDSLAETNGVDSIHDLVAIKSRA